MGKTKALRSTLFTLVIMAVLILLIIIPVSAADDKAAEATNDSLEVANAVSTTTSDQILPDGVYRICNKSTLQSLKVEGYGIANGTNVYADYDQVYDYSNMMEKNALWLVTCLPNGTYSLRPLHKPNMGLSYSSGNVDIYAIGISATSVAYDARWKIFVDEDNPYGYVVQNQGNSSLTMALNTSIGNVYTVEYSGASIERWYFDKLTNAEVESLEGIMVYGDAALKIGNSTSLIAGVFSTTTLSQAVTYSSSYPEATCTSSGRVTGVSEGLFVAGVTSTEDSGIHGSVYISVVSSDRKVATLIGIPQASGNHDHTSYMYTAVLATRYIYGSNSAVSTYTSISHEKYVVGYMTNSDVTVFRGHGAKQSILLTDPDDDNAFRLYSWNLGEGGMRSLSNSDLILYCCCSCGEGGKMADNLVVATYNEGAKNVIGFKVEITCDDANSWIRDFMNAIVSNAVGDEITTSVISNALSDIRATYANASVSSSNMLFMYQR